ncbi:repeat protein [Moumouvirus goulette]|uniref:Repeat protein n=1 Tax=Moumouvirus goulette TaxID=1247379 RepID=M1PY68_9VIRU|nr:repeat protein [Moumouvirus goulette]AGF85727.1 repeat protein [Moumouvirus goulette]
MTSKLYFKITNKYENHNGFQYRDGLNILEEEFNNNPNESCVPGRLYFCKPKYIHLYLDYGTNLREVYLPKDNPNFKMIKDSLGKKYGANMIILGKKYFLGDPKTWEYMNAIGVKFNKKSSNYIIGKNYFECLKYIVSIGFLINEPKYNCLSIASLYDNFEIVKYIMQFENKEESIIQALCQISGRRS